MSRRHVCVWLAIAALLVALPRPSGAYIHLGIDSSRGFTPLKWSASPVRWYASDRTVPGVSASQFQAEVAQAFATWENVPTASIAFQFAGFTSAIPFEDDDLSVFGFDSQPDMDRVLGATTFIVDVVTGAIVESDVFFNSIFPWSVNPAGDTGTIRSSLGGRTRNRPLPRPGTFSDRRNRTAAGRWAPCARQRRRDVSDLAGTRSGGRPRSSAR